MLQYKVEGEGEAIVFLHGFLESSSIWDSITENYRVDYKCISPDLPGHGNSISERVIERMQDIANDVVSVLDEENITKATVIGHSMGGYVGIEMLRNYPDRVEKLCLLNSHAAGDSEKKKDERKRVISVIRDKYQMFLTEAIPNLFSPSNRVKFQKQIKQLIHQCAKYDPEGIVACTKGMRLRQPGIDLLKDSGVECCFIAGDNDPIMPLEKLRKQAEETDSGMFIVKDSGHMSYIENKSETMEYLKIFLNC